MEGVTALGSGRRRTVGDIVAQEEALYAQARAEGLAQGQAEIDARLRQIDAQSRQLGVWLEALARPLALVDAQMQQQLAQLAIAIAKSLLRRELKTDPVQVISIVRETVGLLPAAARDVRVQLHPDDAALLRERLAVPQAGSAWTILEDPMMSRGGCRVTAEAAQIDARLESRIAAVAAELLGDQRAVPRDEPAAGAPP